MAIEWKEEPAFGWGSGAAPIELDSLYRRMYPYYSGNISGVRTPEVVPGYGAGNGWYTARPDYVSQSAINVNEGPISGVSPSNCIGGESSSFEVTAMTIYFPNAHRRWSINYKVSFLIQYQIYDVQIATKWFDEDNNVVTDVVDPGFATAPGWAQDTGQIVWNMGYPCQFAVYYNYADKELYGITISGLQRGSSYGIQYARWDGSAVLIDIKEFANFLQTRNPDMDFGVYEVEIESPEVGPPSEEGGYDGAFGDPTASDSPQVPDVPNIGASQLGFINIYNPSANGLTNLGAEIFPDFTFTAIVDPTGIDIVDAALNSASAFISCLNQIPTMFEMFMNSRLIDFVQDCHVIPVTPTTGSPEHIKLGYRELNTTANKVTSDYVKVPLGSINIEEMRHMFMDFQPYTRAKLYLPFVGFVPLEPDFFQNGSVGVTYIFNVYDGSFVAFVTASPSGKVSKMSNAVIAQYTGTAIVHLPLTGLNYSSMVAGLVGGAGAMMSSIASGNPAATAAAALNTATSSPQVMSSNSYTASAAFMGYRYPFLMIERSTSHFALNYTHDLGIPSSITTKLGSQHGLQVVTAVDLSGVNATDEEKEQLKKLLAEGIYV